MKIRDLGSLVLARVSQKGSRWDKNASYSVTLSQKISSLSTPNSTAKYLAENYIDSFLRNAVVTPELAESNFENEKKD